MRFTGLLLAAGRSRRMGQTKQLLPWPYPDGDSTLLATSFDSLAQACREMVVVMGHDADLIQEALGTRQYTAVLSDPDAEMSHSFQRGLNAIRQTNNTDRILLCPGDHPLITRKVLLSLVEKSSSNPLHVIVPRYQNKGGHPTAIPNSLFQELSETDLSGGLNRWFKNHANQITYLDVADPAIIQDIDSPSDLGKTNHRRL
jgi:molybdenum cofactor cytidylyltransferase